MNQRIVKKLPKDLQVGDVLSLDPLRIVTRVARIETNVEGVQGFWFEVATEGEHGSDYEEAHESDMIDTFPKE